MFELHALACSCSPVGGPPGADPMLGFRDLAKHDPAALALDALDAPRD